MVPGAAVLIGGDVHAVQPNPVLFHPGMAVLEADAPGPGRLHLGAQQDDARLESFFDMVIKPGFPVLGQQPVAQSRSPLAIPVIRPARNPRCGWAGPRPTPSPGPSPRDGRLYPSAPPKAAGDFP